MNDKILLLRISCLLGYNFQSLIFCHTLKLTDFTKIMIFDKEKTGLNKKYTVYNLYRACLDCNRIFLIRKQAFNGFFKIIGKKNICYIIKAQIR